MTGYLAVSVLSHCHCVAMADRDHLSGGTVNFGFVSPLVSGHGVVVLQERLLTLQYKDTEPAKR